MVGRHGKKIAAKGAKTTVKVARIAHRHVAQKPHTYMKDNWAWYAKWHNWKWHRVVHYGTLGSYLLVVGLMVFSTVRIALAADLTNTWDFSSQSEYALDAGVEFNGNSARLKAQEYSSDSLTGFLAHMNSTSGTTVTDSSSNANNGSTVGSPSWGSGRMNNGLTLNGTSQSVSVQDSGSLSLGSQQTIEGWFKPSSTFNNNSSTSQT